MASSTLEATENSTTVRELPLNGRDWTTLAQLQPGVGGVYQLPLGLSNKRANRGLGMQLNIGGTRPQGNNYRLDGISINDYSNAGPGSVLGVLLGVEAVQEFSVVTNNAPASYGRTSGGVINAITRSGTNALHGSVYEFLRNSVLDARNFFIQLNLRPSSAVISSEPMPEGRSSKASCLFLAITKEFVSCFRQLRWTLCHPPQHAPGI